MEIIPTATLAAMLVYTGYKLINFKAIRELRQYGWSEVAIYVVTLGTIVCTDLLTGVITGIVLSALKLLHTFSHLDTKLEVDHAKQVAMLSLEGAATFIRTSHPRCNAYPTTSNCTSISSISITSIMPVSICS